MPPGPAERLRLAQLRAMREHWELALLAQVRQWGLPEPVREYLLIPGRAWRWDLAWPEHRLVVEVHGGNHKRGAHARAGGLDRDYEKGNAANLLGWCALAFSSDQIKQLYAIQTLNEFFRAHGSLKINKKIVVIPP